MKKFIQTLFAFFLMVPLLASGQDLTGIWRGTFYNQYEYLFTGAKYRYEVQITANGNAINGFTPMKGVTYSYQNTRFYGKASLAGRWASSTKDLTLVETKMLDLKIEGGGDGCLMTCYLKWRREGDREFLEGTYTSVSMKNDTMSCGGGVVQLEKVPDSDFKKEDFLEKKKAEIPGGTKPGQNEFLIAKPKAPAKPAPAPTAKAPTPKAQAGTATLKPSTPPSSATKKPAPAGTAQAKKPAPQSKPATVAKPNPAPEQSTKVATPAKIKAENPTASNATPPMAAAKSPNASVPKQTPSVVPPALKTRKNELVEEITTAAKKLEISFYDNGEIDGDTISVFANNRLVVARKGLSAEPITIVVNIDEQETVQELVMVAENLGSLPPNTALMIVQAGTQRYAIRLSSNEQKNALVRFRYDPQSLK
jgi:hypothetical protein